MYGTIVVLAAGLLALLFGAKTFTNGIEWLGKRLNLSEGAVGSVLAAVGTALPETMVPIIAILFGPAGSAHEVGIGAILGAPFMLSTLAFGVVGVTKICYFRNSEKKCIEVKNSILMRDLKYFIGFYTLVISAAFVQIQANMALAAKQVGIWYGVGLPAGQVRTLATIPLYHSYGRACNIDLSLYTAGTIVIVDQPTTDNILAAINQYEPNIWAAVPTMIHGIVNHPDTGKSKIGMLKAVLSGGSALALELLRSFEEISGSPIVEGLGLSEVPYGIVYNPVKGVRKPGSIGVPMPSVDVRIVDVETGMIDMPTGEPGEMIFKTPQVSAGYWNRPEETAEILRDGWLYTGDIGYMDEDGYIFIVDRKKDVLLCSGFSVYPREIDEVLYTHPQVFEACTIGAPDEKRGETVKSCVILKPGATITEQELIDYCRERLAPYKVPKIIEFIDELPRTSLGKPDRKALRALDEAKNR
jgi:long-chain acyl-CoA synthetase